MRRSIYALLSGASLVALATGASAQQAAPSEEVEQVVVTGSRLVQNGFEAPTPVTVLSAESLERHAAPSIPEALRELPSLIKSASPRAAPAASAADPGASAGTFLNLRNLGNQRMLLLMDGMRVPPTRSDGRTDANVIPQMLVSRVEAVTGGASAAYGSDAVSGVINYIIDSRFTGLKGLVQGGVSQRGDGRNYRIGLAAGQSFLDDRLHVVGSAEYRHDAGIDNFCQRPLACDNYVYGGVNGAAGAGSATNPYRPYPNSFLAATSFDGLVGSVKNANNAVNAAATAALTGRNLIYSTAAGGAVLAPHNPGTMINATACTNCTSGAFVPSTITLVPKSVTPQFYGHAEYDLAPDIQVWAQVNYGRSHVHENIGNLTWFGSSGNWAGVYSGNAYLSPAVQAVLNSTGAAFIEFGSYRKDMPNGTYDGLTKNRALSIGVEGQFGETWNWKAYGTDSKSSVRNKGLAVKNAEFYAALDAVRDPATGNIVCRVALTNPGIYPGCAPLNLFGNGSPSQAAINYIYGEYQNTQTTTLKGFGAQITGHPLATWAGPLGVALGYEWREQALTVVSNTTTPFQSVGIRYGNGFTQQYRGNDVQPTSGSYTVGEVFAEVDAPLLKDVSLGDLSVARSLSLNAAVRLTDYSTSGKVNSWKVGTSWLVNEDIRVRVTRSRDVRAPTLNDLYQPQTRSSANFIDPHTNNTGGSVLTISQGNLGLRPEQADTWTAGVILSPSFVPGFTTSIDWYFIDLTDAIQSFGGAQLVAACEASNGTSELCSGIIRPFPFSDRTPQNFPRQFFAQSFNAVQQILKGVDWEASYRRELLGGEVNLRALATYQYVQKTQSSPQNPLVNSAGYAAQPELVMTASIGYQKGPFGIDVQTRRIGEWNQNSPPGTTGTLTFYQEPVVKPVYYTSLSATYDFQVGSSKRMQAFANINNLFDKKPPLIPTIATPGLGYPTERTLYDVVLRDFTIGLRFQY